MEHSMPTTKLQSRLACRSDNLLFASRSCAAKVLEAAVQLFRAL